MSKLAKETDDNPLDMIRDALVGLEYGELVIKVENGQIAMISRTHKIRPRAARTSR